MCVSEKILFLIIITFTKAKETAKNIAKCLERGKQNKHSLTFNEIYIVLREKIVYNL